MTVAYFERSIFCALAVFAARMTAACGVAPDAGVGALPPGFVVAGALAGLDSSCVVDAADRWRLLRNAHVEGEKTQIPAHVDRPRGREHKTG